MRTVCILPPTSVCILGIDDWAWKKGQTYGTILVDLEKRIPIDLLPDRSTETVEAWLREHPEVEIVSRDRKQSCLPEVEEHASDAIPAEEREGVCLIPTSTTFCSAGNTDAATVFSSSTSSKLVASQALLLCSESF